MTKNKLAFVGVFAALVFGFYLFTQSAKQASINLVGMGTVTRTTGTTTKTTLKQTSETGTTKPAGTTSPFAGAKIGGGKTEDGASNTQAAGQSVTTSRPGEKTDNGGAELTRSASGVTTTKTSPKEDGGNPFEGANLGGGTTSVVTQIVQSAEGITGIDIDKNGRVSNPNQQITKSDSGVTPVRTGEKLSDGGAEISKSASGVTTRPASNSSQSPDDRQETADNKAKAMEALFAGSSIGGGYSGSDGQGNAVTSRTETNKLDDGGKTVTTTRTITAPSGNEILISKVEKYNPNGEKIDENTTTITKTLNENGTYITNLTNTSGVQTTLYSPDKQSDTFYAPPASNKVPVALKTGADTAGSLSPDKQTEIVCPKDTKLVKTRARGSVCAPTTGSTCGPYAFPLNGKCYPIGDEVTPGNYVCDWTVGGRPNVKYPFLSTNCPTQSASNAVEPKSAQECSAGDNAGWWDNNAKKCYRPGQQVRLDANTMVPVCEGGRVGLDGTCPEYQATGDSGNLGSDRNSGQFNPPAPQFPIVTGTGNSLSPDKQNVQKNCRIDLQCSFNGSASCSNNGDLWKAGICIETNPVVLTGGSLSPDKLPDTSIETGGSLSPDARLIQKNKGKTDQVVKKDTDCMLYGAVTNNNGYFICPAEDGSINQDLQDKDPRCDVNLFKLEGLGCLTMSYLDRLWENLTNPNDSQGLNVDPTLDGNLDGGTKGPEDTDGAQLNTDALVREGDSCLDANNRNQQGVIKDGVCVSTTR